MFAPEFFYSGFRYAQIEGLEEREILPENFEAVAVYSDIPYESTFVCSNEKINRFHHCTLWSQKSNFADIPTDCPQREKSGWTGDAQVFARTACYLSEPAAFYRKWLRDVRDCQRENGMVRPIALGLVDGAWEDRIAEALNQLAMECRYQVGTGFLSTPFLLQTLAEHGYTDTAYRMLENTAAPGWLAMVEQGAVCSFLYDTICGIRIDGRNHAVIEPKPGGTLLSAAAEYQSP